MMKATLKKLTQPPFERLVDEALEIYRSIHAAGTHYGDARDEKLSARGFLNEALKNARTTRQKIEELDKVVAKLPEDGNQELFRFLSTTQRQAEATRMDQGVSLRPVVGNLHRMVGGDPAAYVGVIVQSNALGSNPFEIVALAALRATRDHPDNFGSIDDWDKHHAAQEERQARLNELYAQIAEAWKEAPIEFDQIGADGRALISIKCRDITMPVAPPATLGERLCMALI